MAKFKVGDIVYFKGDDNTCRYKIIEVVKDAMLDDTSCYNLENLNNRRIVEGVFEYYLLPCETTEDVVNYPSHYMTGKFECIEVMQEALGVDAVKNFCLCNAFKYIYRHNRKNGLEDIKKAQWYINKYIELSEE